MAVFQEAVREAGMRMRMSPAAVMLAADGVSVTVISGVAEGPGPTVKVSFVAEEIVGVYGGKLEIERSELGGALVRVRFDG